MRLKFKNIGIAIILFGAGLYFTIKLYLRRTLVPHNFIQQKPNVVIPGIAGYLKTTLSISLFLNYPSGVKVSF